MSSGQIAVLVAAIACFLAVGGLLVAVVALRRQVDRLSRLADELKRQTVPLVADAHRVVATVDSASRLAYRAFANPVVKVLAVRAGAASGIRRLATTDAEGSARRNGEPRNGSGHNGTTVSPDRSR
jgi:NADP-dependent 3-hydroxy acid dehydrogenase YdfG